MRSDDLQRCLDLRRADLDPELFVAAAALQYISRLIAAGGGSVGRPDGEALTLHHLAAFLARSVESAHQTRRFEQEWRRLLRMVPQIYAAWGRGQALFQEDLARATANPEEMEYFSHIDFAEDCYAPVDARRTILTTGCCNHGPPGDTWWPGGCISLQRKTRLVKQGLSGMDDSLCGHDWKRGSNFGHCRRVGLSAGVHCSIVDVKVVGSLLLDIVSRADGRGGGGRRQDRGEEPSREHEVSPPEPDAGVAPHA